MTFLLAETEKQTIWRNIMPDKRPYSRDEVLKFTTTALSRLQAERRKALKQRTRQMQAMMEQQQQQQQGPAQMEQQPQQVQPGVEYDFTPDR